MKNKNLNAFKDIEWELTGDVLDRIDIYDHSEVVVGYDKIGNEFEGVAEVSCGEIIDVDDIELVEIGGPSIVQPPHISTEVDLDRDVPYGEIEWDGSGVNADGWEGWNVNDRIDENGEILLTINPNNTDEEWMNEYCDKHPDFNDALNGEYKFDDDVLPGFDSWLENHLIA